MGPFSRMKKDGILRRCCRSRPVQYLNNILEQDHRAIKRRVKAKQGFCEFHAARRTIQGYEAMHMIRKGQAGGGGACRTATLPVCRKRPFTTHTGAAQSPALRTS